MPQLAPKNKGWAQSWKRIRKFSAASLKCQELFRPPTEQGHQEIHSEVIQYPPGNAWAKGPRGTPQHLTSTHPGGRRIALLQKAFMQRIPKIFYLPLLIGVLKWFSGSHWLLTINLQQNKIHILFLAQFHPYPALLQEGANGNRHLWAKRKAHWTEGQDAQERHHTSLLQGFGVHRLMKSSWWANHSIYKEFKSKLFKNNCSKF